MLEPFRRSYSCPFPFALRRVCPRVRIIKPCARAFPAILILSVFLCTTAGVRPAALAAVLGGAAVGVYSVVSELVENNASLSYS